MDFRGSFFQIKDYQITDEKLGEGTFGEVFIIKNLKDNGKYAVKIIKPSKGFDGEDQMQFMRESMILYQIQHPAVVKFYGINFQSFSGSQKLEPSIITEYLPNKSLKEILLRERHSIADSKWTPTKKIISLIGIAGAMSYLHDHNIMHRDLKPENILMDENYYPRICDFGLSRCFPENLSQTKKNSMTNQIGTPLYMAPEILKDEHNYDFSVDVYSFAILAYEIASGQEPYKELGNITPFNLAFKVASGYRPKFNKNVTEKMKELLSKCWNEDVNERPSFNEIFQMLSNDFSYLGEDVDSDEVREYVEIIRDANSRIESGNKIEKNFSKKSDELLSRALFVLNGNKSERNVPYALNLLKQSSESGNSFASLHLGLLYENGENVEKNIDKALFYYQKSAEQGNSSGMRRIGLCYENGFGVEQDYSKAFEFYDKAAKLGNTDAMNSLGIMYNKGKGVCKDPQKAIDFFEQSSELGNSYAINNLAMMYSKGVVFPKNYSKAIELLEKACKLDNMDALNNLGGFYRDGRGVQKDYDKMIDCYKRSAELGNSKALNNLALSYQKGTGVEKDCQKAIELFEKAAELGNADALNNLGFAYMNGIGVQQNYEKMIDYLQKSAELGNSDALCNLGLVFQKGKGVEIDYKKAIEFFEKSAELGNSHAYNNLGTMYERGNHVPCDYSKAIENYEKAAELGGSTSLINLGGIYEYGKGVSQDYQKALEYYKRADKKGNKHAKDKIKSVSEKLKDLSGVKITET